MNSQLKFKFLSRHSYFGLQKQVFNQIQELPLKLSPWFGVSFPLLLPCPMCARAGRKKSKLLGRRPLIIIQELKMWRFSMLSSILHQAATAMSNWKLLALPGGVARTWHMAPDEWWVELLKDKPEMIDGPRVFECWVRTGLRSFWRNWAHDLLDGPLIFMLQKLQVPMLFSKIRGQAWIVPGPF